MTAGTEAVAVAKENVVHRTVSGAGASSSDGTHSDQTLRESREVALQAPLMSQQANVVKENTQQVVEDSSVLDHTATGVVQLSIFGEQELAPAKPQLETSEVNPIVRQILRKVKNADVMNMTPLQAMQLLNELKNKANGL